MVQLSPKKSTKFVELTFQLMDGHRLRGQYHVPDGTSSAMRPSDALDTKAFISLVDCRLEDPTGVIRDLGFVQLAPHAIAWVEFPQEVKGWKKGVDAGAPHGHKAMC